MPLIKSLSDDFNDNSIGSTWGGLANAVEQNQRIELNASSVIGPGQIESVSAYTIIDNYIMVELVDAGNQALNTVYADLFLLHAPTGQNIQLYVYQGALRATWTGLGFNYWTTYNPETMRWLRIREATEGMGIMYFEYSANAVNWAELAAVTDPFSTTVLSNLQAVLLNYNSSGTQTTVIFDNLNHPVYDQSIEALAGPGGEATLTFESSSFSIESVAGDGGVGTYSTVYQALPQKDYEYRVFDSDGNYIGTWENPTSDFGYSQTINQNATELTVSLARSPDNRIVKTQQLLDELSSPILDNNSDPILVQTETANAVGPDTDVDLNYNVDIYTFYGGYETLQDEFGDDILDENSSAILVQFGAPNGLRVYSGYIADYELTYGNETGVEVLVVPHATEMSHYVYMDGSGNTTISYTNADPVLMARNAMDNYATQGGVITYTAASMPLSGESASYEFNLQTTREVQDKSVTLLPVGYYHYVHPGENLQYLLPKSETAHHTFWYENISELKLKKSITQLVNKVYYVGGEVSPDVDLFKYYEDAPSIAANRPGLDRPADSRVTLATSAQALSQREINEFKDPRYRTSVTISDGKYDIETIKLGQMVAFKNFGTFVDDLLLQIVTLHKRKHTVTMDLDMVVFGDAKRLEEIKKNIQSENVRNIPAIPS